MALPDLYARLLNFPPLPQYIVDKIDFNYQNYLNYDLTDTSPENCIDQTLLSPENKRTMNSHHNTELLNEWCHENICDSMHFFWMLRSFRDQRNHKDVGTKVKLIYVLDPGGDQVTTTWYADDQKTVLQKIQLETHQWYILKTDMYHQVQGVEHGRVRFCVGARIFD